MATTQKNLDYCRKNAEEDYLTTPISVLRYISELEAALRIHDVVGRSEQLTCPRCKSTNILNPDKDNDAQCIECALIWAD